MDVAAASGGSSSALDAPASAFDALAPVYDSLWTNTTTGRLQRDAVWRYCRHLFHTGETVLDLGCGTGEDAVILGQQGVHVIATDSSSAMVRIARERGVDARWLPIGEIGSIGLRLDGAISNFGALNCVAIPDLRRPLADMIRSGGYLAICVMGRFCLWETLWYAARGQFRKAARRWKGEAPSLPGLKVFYPTVREIEKALSPDFALITTAGIGIFVPPSYVRGIGPALLNIFARIDAGIARWPGIKALSDHRLLVFRKN